MTPAACACPQPSMAIVVAVLVPIVPMLCRLALRSSMRRGLALDRDALVARMGAGFADALRRPAGLLDVHGMPPVCRFLPVAILLSRHGAVLAGVVPLVP